MALLDDIGVTNGAPPVATGSLLSDIGLKDQDTKVSAHPVTEEFGDVIGNTAKHLAVGVGKLADLPGQVWDMAFHPEGDEEPADIATKVTSKVVGKPKNESSLGRVMGAAEESAPSAILGGPEALLPTMASGAASQTAAELGGGPTTQFVAGLTPLAPSAAAGIVRRAVRGGVEGAANMQENINNAQNAGLKLSTGQLANNSALRSVETTGSHLPGGSTLEQTRGAGLNKQVEESVDNIVHKLSPNTSQNPPTPTTAGEIIQPALKGRVTALKQETSDVADAMYEAGGGKDAPASAPKLEATISKVTNPTGIPEVDNLITKSKTKAVEKTVKSVTDSPQVPISYSTDNGVHVVKSPNGETQAMETSQGGVRVFRSDTSEAAQGKGEGTARLEALAKVASSKGQPLVSDNLVSQAEAKVYDKLGNKGWKVEKNPETEVDEGGNLKSSNPFKPVYSVTAPKTQEVPGSGQISIDPEKHFEGEWTYDPATGKSEPTTSPQVSLTPNAQKPILNPETPWTLGSLKQLRTDIGQNIGRTNGEAKRQLQAIYGAVSDDLKSHMQARGPEAEQAWDLFNNVAKQNAATQKTLVKAVKEIGGPEAAFKAAIGGSKDGASRVAPIFNTLDEDGKNLFRATVLHRMGRAAGAADAPFDANKFMDNWKGMSPEAKNLLFGEGANAGPPTQLRKSLDSLTSSLDMLRSQGQIKSGFVKGIEQGTSGYKKLGILGALVLLKEVGGEAAMHAVEGHPFLAAGAATGAAGALAGNPIMSKVLTNPKTVAWLAQATKAPKGMVPVLLNQLNQMGNKDPDAKDLYGLISESK